MSFTNMIKSNSAITSYVYIFHKLVYNTKILPSLLPVYYEFRLNVTGSSTK